VELKFTQPVLKKQKYNNMDVGSCLKDHQKLVEELLELATVITQQLNKSSKDLTPQIIEEIGDVRHRMNRIMKYYDEDKIQEQIEYKREGEQKKKERAKRIAEEKSMRRSNFYGGAMHDKFGKV
jgi:hypothetical protein